MKNGMIYYGKLLCGAYTGPNNTTVYPEVIQCQKGYDKTGSSSCSQSSSSPAPSSSKLISESGVMINCNFVGNGTSECSALKNH